ncbi:MAG: Segregation and condensation protein A [Parcubacteria group bacterium GW2011_GWC1_42_11]|uniref:Segregation and condensation protein A n=1 Tax=Candidatus Nomurabacteria bacterium GW2011_GWC2_42_20 TaxID=1618756 RepID=A0A0G1CBK1_9BACT|nr:MAG: Segregation and condensation protein A [Parcubacteria group bacterium GW2011_GWC1_42_11]KKS47023.1 MAG: Segregation and condensation protein A [Candidatus Nomurabacteria bacterium GW2011_GWC2_42_20]KKS59228.1 MAG: Segregation and condensation protein A [Candidatus Nomurabacteria bacterium GW2011_GWA2_42_41]KKT09163.1 MAG: Segregation and condensation protein A [Candidatus Nomurabacteria bacterium GW2011_GWB1_43_20]TAN35492.1 MAG: segregation/condensation protein A [Patescibacteria group
MPSSDYQIKTDVFEGPLELLLDLVEKRKLFINEISLAQVADDYIAHLKQFEKMPVDFVSNFLIVASTLILIKSKSLLPTLSLTDEETQDIDELERRLKEYQKIRELSINVKQMFGANVLFPKGQAREKEIVFTPSEEVTDKSIFSAMRDVIAHFPKKITLPKVVVKKVISLEEMMDRLTTRITGSLKMSFKDFAGVGKEEKVNVIVSFLAMLELVKQGIIAVTQGENDDDIQIETKVLDTPNYGAN